jgi:hypothetical protein
LFFREKNVDGRWGKQRTVFSSRNNVAALGYLETNRSIMKSTSLVVNPNIIPILHTFGEALLADA